MAGGHASLPTSPQIPAASTDNPFDWNGLAGLGRGQPKEGALPGSWGSHTGAGLSSQQQTLCTVFSIPVFE